MSACERGRKTLQKKELLRTAPKKKDSEAAGQQWASDRKTCQGGGSCLAEWPFLEPGQKREMKKAPPHVIVSIKCMGDLSFVQLMCKGEKSLAQNGKFKFPSTARSKLKCKRRPA